MISLTLYRVGNNKAFPNQTWATTLSGVRDPMTLMDKYDISSRPEQFHWHILSGQRPLQIKLENPTFLGYAGFQRPNATTLNIRIQAMSKNVSKTHKRLPGMQSNTSWAVPSSDTSWKMGPYRQANGRSLKKLHIQYSIVVNHS